MRTKNFTKQCHAPLREEHSRKPKPESYGLKRLAKIGRDACAESVSQRGEQQVEGAGEFEQFTISDFERITEERSMAMEMEQKASEILQGLGCFLAMVLPAFTNSYPISFHGYDRAIRKRLAIPFQRFKAKCALFFGRQIDESHDA